MRTNGFDPNSSASEICERMVFYWKARQPRLELLFSKLALVLSRNIHYAHKLLTLTVATTTVVILANDSNFDAT